MLDRTESDRPTLTSTTERQARADALHATLGPLNLIRGDIDQTRVLRSRYWMRYVCSFSATEACRNRSEETLEVRDEVKTCREVGHGLDVSQIVRCVCGPFEPLGGCSRLTPPLVSCGRVLLSDDDFSKWPRVRCEKLDGAVACKTPPTGIFPSRYERRKILGL